MTCTSSSHLGQPWTGWTFGPRIVSFVSPLACLPAVCALRVRTVTGNKNYYVLCVLITPLVLCSIEYCRNSLKDKGARNEQTIDVKSHTSELDAALQTSKPNEPNPIR